LRDIAADMPMLSGASRGTTGSQTLEDFKDCNVITLGPNNIWRARRRTRPPSPRLRGLQHVGARGPHSLRETPDRLVRVRDVSFISPNRALGRGLHQPAC